MQLLPFEISITALRPIQAVSWEIWSAEFSTASNLNAKYNSNKKGVGNIRSQIKTI